MLTLYLAMYWYFFVPCDVGCDSTITRVERTWMEIWKGWWWVRRVFV